MQRSYSNDTFVNLVPRLLCSIIYQRMKCRLTQTGVMPLFTTMQGAYDNDGIQLMTPEVEGSGAQ